MKKSIFKIAAVAAMLSLSFGLTGCGSDKTAEKSPVKTVEQASPSAAEKPDADANKNKAVESKAEAEKIVQDMKPTAELIKNNAAAAINEAKNLSVTVADRDLFDVSFDLDIPDKSEESAKTAGVEAIRAVQGANPNHQFSLISVMVTCKGAPVGAVSCIPTENKYVIVAKGKRSEFTP